MQSDAPRNSALSMGEDESCRARPWQRLLSLCRLLFYLVCGLLLSFSLVLVSLDAAFRPFLQPVMNATHLALVVILLLLYPLLLIAHLKGRQDAVSPTWASRWWGATALVESSATNDRVTRIRVARARYGHLARLTCICGCLYLGSLQVLLQVLLREGYISATDGLTPRISEVIARLLLVHAVGLLLISPALAAQMLFWKMPTRPDN
jgi:hypothetical protein